MKKCFSRYRLALFALFIITSAAYADVTWRGTSASDVIDNDIVIKDDVLLKLGSTRIEAIHRDVTITLTRDAVISGHWAGESQLYLMAAEGRTIRFVLDHDLKFIGSSAVTGDDLLIVQSGPGNVEVELTPGNRFKIASQNGSGGVQMYVLMYGGESAPCADEYCNTDEYCCEEYCDDEYCILGSGQNETSEIRPVLRFITASDVSRDSNTKIVIGRKSRLSFLSSRKIDMAQDTGYIEFDPSSDGLGRMVLKIKNTGAVIAGASYTCQRNGGCITTETIDPTIPAGFEAVWSIFNSRGADFSAGLLVLNENDTLYDFFANSFLNLEGQGEVTRGPGQCLTGFTGERYGAVIAANGVLWVQSNAYLDYVGLSLNQMPDVVCVPGFEGIQPSRIIKMRNPSALIIDGSNNPDTVPARFLLDENSAVYLRSGVANDGTIRDLSDPDPFTIDASQHTPGVGNIVLDVEGELNVEGIEVAGEPTSKIELLSLEVLPTGGSLFVDGDQTNFPLRTFNTEDNEQLTYNTGAFLINNTMNLYDTALSHTDVNHQVIADNDVRSEPTYIGGETFKLIGSPVRPSIRFFNSNLLVHSDIALTGVDLVVPNLVDDEGIQHKNSSDFAFFSSGACATNGTGRQMVLGTRIGSTAADGCSRIDSDAHLDVMQLFNAVGADYPVTDTDNQTLHLVSDLNDESIIGEDAVGFSVNTIYLGNNSNISIGTPSDSTGFNIDTNPWLRIQGNYFSFTTRGGSTGCANRSNITGQGGIFVDLNGKLSIDPGYMASFCVLVTRSHNGIVDLPAGQVFFCDGLGIVNGDVDLSNPEDQILVQPGQEISDLILNWTLFRRDCEQFAPYQPTGACCPAVTVENVSALPIIQGTVDNLIIQNSRFGDPATFIVDAGVVRGVTFESNSSNCCGNICPEVSGLAPVATIVLRNNGTFVVSGENAGATGFTFIADGSGRIDLAGDMTIASRCSFVRGPNFAEGDVLTISADIAREIIVPASGALDLRTFNVATDVIEFVGLAQLAIEPGASIVLGGGTLRFGGDSQIRFEAAPNAAGFFQAIPHGAHNPALDPLAIVPAADEHNQFASLTDFGAGLHNTDSFRIKLMGQGALELSGNAQAFVPVNAFVGVETTTDDSSDCPVETTDFEIRLLDNAQFIIGQLDITQGGVFQIGNVEDQNATPTSVRQPVPNSVSFTLTLNGPNANWSIGSQGFMGLGVGIERFDGMNELGEIVPNENIVNTLFNVSSITFNFLAGRFEHDRIFPGNDPRASLLALSADESIAYNMILDSDATQSDFNIAGGGNLALVYPGEGGLHPIVLEDDNQIEVAPGIFHPRLRVGILASSLLQNNPTEQSGLTGLEFFEVLKTHDAVLEPERPNTFGRANASTLGEASNPDLTSIRIDTVSQDVIIRGDVTNIIGPSGTTEVEDRQVADEMGAVFVNIDQELNEILTVSLIP